MANPYAQYAPNPYTTVTTQRDPLAVKRDARADNADARAAEAAARAEANSAEALRLAREKFEYDKRQDALENPPKPPEQVRAVQSLADDEVLAAIAQARAGISGWSTGLPGQVLGNIGGTDARALAAPLSTIASRLTLDKLQELKSASATGASGLGSLTEKEGALLRDSVAGLDQYQDGEALRKALDAVELHYRNMRALADGRDYRLPEVQQQYGIGEVARNNTRAVDASLAAPGAAQQALPVPPDLQREIVGYVAARTPEQLDAQDFAAFLNAAFKRHNYPARVEPDEAAAKVRAIKGGATFGGVDPVAQELGGLQGAVNSAAQSAPGAFMINFADALTGSNLDGLTADPALARGGMRAVSDANPWSSTGGQIGGMVAGTLGAGKALGMATALPGALRGTAAADTLYGTVYGAGSSDEDRITGALLGGGAGLVGNRLGNKAGDVATGLMRGVTNPDVQFLASRRVPMTYGQMRGGGAKATEERAMSNPFIGDTIRDRQVESLTGFNRAVFDETGARLGTDIPEIGQQGIAQAQAAAGALYDNAHVGMRWSPDAAMSQTLGDIQRRQAANGILTADQLGQVASNVSSNVGSRMRNGAIEGPAFKKAMSQMRTDAKNMDPAVGAAVSEYRDAILTGARGQSDPVAVALLDQADAVYPHVKVLEQSVGAARNQGDNLFTPAQLGTAAYNQTKKFGGVSAAARGDVPYNELQQAAVAVLPNRIPNSGTAERLMGNSLRANLVQRAQAAVAAPLYAPGSQEIIEALLLQRPDALRRAGESDVVRGLLGANVGAPLMLTYVGD